MTALNNTKKFSLVSFLSLLSIPFILRLEAGKWLGSISAYYYENPALFAVLLGIAGWTYIQGGLTDKKHYFDTVIGLALFGVIFTPCFNENVIFELFNYGFTVRHLHYFFAIIVFEGSVFNMIVFSSGRYRFYMILLGLLMNLIIFGSFYLEWYSLLWLEFFGMIIMSFHKFLEIKKIID